MDLAALLILPLVGAALGRWTRLAPIVVGLVVALPVGALALVVFGGAMSPAALPAAALAGVIAAALAAIGGFVGWLRRKHLERNG